MIDCHQKVIIGDIMTRDVSFWKSPRWKLLVFVSSTFTDTYHERNILLEKVLPQLRLKGLARGNIEVSMVDMRFGVRDESTLSHNTWIECALELERCYANSASLFFLSLQAEKYGYRPLPRAINESIFASMMGSLAEETTRQLALKWYKLDENNQPPLYVLQNLKSIDDSEYWNIVLPRLLPFLDGHSLEFVPLKCLNRSSSAVTSPPDFIIGRSVTEWELKYAYLLDQQGGDNSSLPPTRSYWSHRVFRDGISSQQDPKKHFNDTSAEASTALKLAELKRFMENKFVEGTNLSTYLSSLPLLSYINNDSTAQSYRDQWEADISSMLSAELEKIITLREGWDLDGDGFGLRGGLLEEILQHCEAAAMKCSSFVGREAELSLALSHLYSASRYAEDDSSIPPNDLEGVCLVINGTSGIGKSGFMAQLFHRVYREEFSSSRPADSPPAPAPAPAPARPVVIRFCGTTAASSNARHLMESICCQILYIYSHDVYGGLSVHSGLQHLPVEPSSSDSYAKYVAYFHEVLRLFPVILLIDSLDQLSDQYLERSQLSFLVGAKPNKSTRIVVSTLNDERTASGDGWKRWHGCDTLLTQHRTPRVSLLPFSTGEGDMPSNDAVAVVRELLFRSHRTLTPEQWQHIGERLSRESSSLYITLVVRVVMNWCSYDNPLDDPLPPTIPGIITRILHSVESQYGALLTRRAFSLMTYSKGGLRDNEIEDLISLDEQVLNSVFQYHTPTTRRLPAHVWSRIRNSVKDLLSTRDDGCLVWCHRQIQEVASSRYAGERHESHRLMGRYFGNLLTADILRERHILSQRLTLNDRPVWHCDQMVNRRRARESLYHLIESNQVLEAITEFCSLEFICAACLAQQSFNLLQCASSIKLRLSQSPPLLPEDLTQRFEHYFKWIRNSMTAMNNDPCTQVFVTVTATQPLTSCVRTDLMSLWEQKQPKSVRVTQIPTDSLSMSPFRSLLGVLHIDSTEISCEAPRNRHHNVSYELRGAREMSGCPSELFDRQSWIRGVCLGGKSDFDNLVSVLYGHTSEVEIAVWSPDSTLIASGGYDGTIRIWDASLCAQLLSIDTSRAVVASLSWCPDSRKICGSYRGRQGIVVWESTTGVELRSLLGYMAGVVSWSPHRDRECIAFGSSYQNMVCVWWLDTNAVLELSGHTGPVYSLCWHPREETFLSAGFDNTIYLWSLASKSGGAVYSNEEKNCRAVSWSRCGQKIAVGDGNTIRILDSLTYSVTNTLLGHSYIVVSLAWHPTSSDLLLSGGGDSLAIVSSVHWDSTGQYAVTASSDKLICVWDVSADHLSAAGGEVQMAGHWTAVSTLAWRPVESESANDSDRRGYALASLGADGSLILWDTSSTLPICYLEGQPPGFARVICWSSDGRRLVTSASDHLIRLWDAMSGEVLFTFTGHTDKVNGVTWNPDDTLLASTSFDGTLRLWDALVPSEGRVLVAAKASCAEGGAYCVSWSPDGTLLAACLRFVQEVSIRIWNVGDQSPSSVSCHDLKFELKYHILLGRTLNVASQLSWNPRSTSLVAAIGAGIAVWSLESASLEYSVSDPHGSLSIGCVDWSLDGRAIVAGGVDGYVRVFRADNGALVARLSGHDQTITGCMWSKDSRHIASCSMDSRVIVWDSLLV